MKVRTAVARCLADTGVDTVFGVLGGGNMYMVHDLVHEYGVRYISAAREDGAVLMADGYARVSGRFGLASVTYGPGLTNAVSAITEAARARTPMLILTGHAPAAELPQVWQSIQTIDHEDLIRPTGAAYRTVRTVRSAARDVAEAVRTALVEHRPVVLGVPTDLQELTEDFHFPSMSAAFDVQALHPDPEALDRAVGVVASSTRCVVLAGRGAVASGCRAELVALARTLNAHLATTVLAKDYFAGEPLNVGIVGTLAGESAGTAFSKADCILVVGAALNPLTASGGALLEGKRVVQVDVDPMHLGRHFPVDVGVVGDAKLAVRAMRDMLLDAGIGARAEGRGGSGAAAPSGRSRELDFEDLSTDVTVDMRTAVIRLDEMLPAERTVVVDGGRFTASPLMYLGVPQPQALVVPLSFSAVGAGLPAAVGAAFGHPRRKTCLVAGDGGIMMSLVEFNTAVQNRLDLVVVVLNDGAYGQEITRFKRAGMDPSLAYLHWPELAPLAVAFGGRGITVRNLADVDALKPQLMSNDGPVLIDVKIDSHAAIGTAY